MNIATTLIGQSIVLHLVLWAGVAYWAYKQLGPFTKKEKLIVGISCLVPFLGPILITLYTAYFLVAKKSQKQQQV